MVLQLKKVFISDEVDPRCVEVLKENGIEVVKDTKLRTDKDKFLAEISKYDGLIVRSATKVTADVINAATNLKIIGRAGTGVDNIDCEAATKRGIIVMNTPGGNTLSAAEHTCALMCSLSRDIPNAVATMRAGKWDRKAFMGSELYGKTLAIIGLGRIGKEVALRMQSFGMKTIGYDPIIPGSVSAEFGVEWMELEQLWPQADYITVHTPLIPQTKNLIGEATFAKCKKGVRVVNCARGGIIDEVALLKALDAGQCGGAGLDVYINEPPDDYTLAQHSKVIPTPHLGANTVEAQKRVAVEIAEQFVDVMNGKSLFGALNAQAMQNALSPATQPWVQLGKCLGTVLSSLGSDSKKGVSISFSGDDLKNAGSYLSASVLSGLLATQGGGEGTTLNLVSAPALAKQTGINVEAKFGSVCPTGLSASVSVTVGGNTVVGTTSGSQPILVSINGSQFATPAVLNGTMILFQSNAAYKVTGALNDGGATVTGFSLTTPAASQWGLIYVAAPVSKGLDAIKTLCQSAVQLQV